MCHQMTNDGSVKQRISQAIPHRFKTKHTILCACVKTCKSAPTESQSCMQHAHEDARRQVFVLWTSRDIKMCASLNHQITLSSWNFSSSFERWNTIYAKENTSGDSGSTFEVTRKNTPFPSDGRAQLSKCVWCITSMYKQKLDVLHRRMPQFQ